MDGIKKLRITTRSETTNLRQPKEIAHYSRTENFEFKYNSDECLNYYYFPELEVFKKYSLVEGFSKFVHKEFEKGDLIPLLGQIIEYERSLGTKVKGDLISLRGLITKLLVTPYVADSETSLNVMYFDGQIFFQEDSECAKERKKAENSNNSNSKTSNKDKLMFSGYKFEKLCMINRPFFQVPREEIENRHKQAVSTESQYLSVVRTGIGNVKLVLGGEIDGVYDYLPDLKNEPDAKENVLNHYVEVKTNFTIKTPGNAISYERKLFRTWGQCFLLGIPNIVVGFRDDDLNLVAVEEYKTSDIPMMLKNSPIRRHNNNKGNTKFNCADALKWLGAALEWIQNTIPRPDTTEEQLKTIFRLSFGADDYLTLRKLNDQESAIIFEKDPLLSNDFINWRMSAYTK